MPFTLSHVAAVLPGLTLRASLWPAVPALVVGSMAPDLPYYLPLGMTREQSHSFVGAFGVTVVAVLIALLWDHVLARPARAFAPAGWRARLHEVPVRTRLCDLPLAVVAAYVGVLSHLALDAPTHGDGALTMRWALLRQIVAGVPVWSWLMLLTSAAGLVLLAAAVVRVLRRPARPVVPSAWGLWPLVLIGAAGLVGAGLAVGAHSAFDIDLIWYGTTGGVSLALAVAVVPVLGWWVVRPDHR